MSSKVLIVDDEQDIVELVAYNLEKEGFKVLKAYNGEDALQTAQEKAPEVILLDLMLPGIQGLEVCKQLRENPKTTSISIIMLTAKGGEIDRILGLELGADDYIAKPFSVKELIARVKAVLRRIERRREADTSDILECKGLRIDLRSYEVTVDKRRLELSPMEFKLLKFFAQNPGRVYSREQILDKVWGDDSLVEPRTVDVHVRRLRAQMERSAKSPNYIITVRSVGYKFIEEP
jgi:two-component system alkaline phosphatase synthesis response regulator PhoP